MHRRYFCAAVMFSLLLLLAACSTTNGEFRPGYDLRADFAKKDSAKFILTIGQRGYLDLDGKEYAFELIRINSMSNVSIEMIPGGEVVDLSAQMLKVVSLPGYGGKLTFEFSTMAREAAVIYVYVDRAQAAPKTVETTQTDTIRLHIKALEDTTATLSLDGKPSQEIPLPKGSEVTWNAETSAEIDLPQARKADLEINGVTYRPAEGSDVLHLVAKRQDGRLVIENR